MQPMSGAAGRFYKNVSLQMFGLASTMPVVLALSVFLTGCTSSSADVDRLTAEVKQLKEENQQLQAKITELQATPQKSATTTANATSSDLGAKDVTAAFSDTAGMFGEKEINDLIRIGVLDPKAGKFEPNKPVTRAEFVTWLVTANNALRPDKSVRPAEPGSAATFPDVPTSHADFKWIQGMSNAGWSIGYEDKTFKPDKILTREEMFAIKAPFDEESAGSVGATTQLGWKWADWKKINPRYIEPMGAEAAAYANWPRVFGDTKNCDPQKAVTRAEAAVCVWQFGARKFEWVSAKAKDADKQ